ncbi:MAG TPA: DUF885 domain-containing protein [Solirubrobacteraceae bacterium]|nr:DUF885 domain-containing protein [Solirubrobacteraceae bacterium]
MTSVRALGDTFHERWLATHPFAATNYGIPGYDDRVPDDGEAGDAAWRTELDAILAEAEGLDSVGLSDADAVTLGCLRENVAQELRSLDDGLIEHTVTAMPFSGPAVLLATAARTVLVDEQAATDYLERLRRSGEWIDQQSERLRIGAGKGRLPVAPLVQEAIEWAAHVLEPAVPEALAVTQPPEGSDGEAAWREQRDAVASEVVKPALARWAELLGELLPRARSADEPGLVYLPGGEADYALRVQSATTLPLAPEEIHRVGLGEVEALEERALELGARVGLTSLPEIHRALRASSETRSPTDAMAAATAAIRRAEAQAGEVFPQPLPPPCEVSPMPSVVASSGMAPHYTPPKLDGSRPGTFWFNLERPTAGAGWELEGVAFHEGVPGHHLQISRLQMLDELPAMQRQRSLTVFAEGWALYAEQLAEEMGLYADTESLLGEVSTSLMRAARLVVDTGLHALGWTRAQALEFMVAHVPLPEPFLANEIDRYIVMPAQALSYLIGKRELVRIRDDARRRLGPRFALPEFHAVVLDSGSLPIPVLEDKLRRWSGAGDVPTGP